MGSNRGHALSPQLVEWHNKSEATATEIQPENASVATATEIQPAFHVHVSGSGGTSLCKMARQQPTAKTRAGHAYACFLPCKGNLNFRDELSHRPARCASMYASCATLEKEVLSKGYNVMGMAETFLSEIGQPAPKRRPACVSRGCCMCNTESLAARHSCAASNRSASEETEKRALFVQRGAQSPMDAQYPLSGWIPWSTFCPNLAYTFVMQDPVRRIVSMLWGKCKALGCARTVDEISACAERVYEDVIAHDLVVDTNDGEYMTGTAAIDNYNIRLLLGPRTFFARLGAINETHYQAAAAMVERFVLSAPLTNLSDIAPALTRTLHWPAATVLRSNAHNDSPERAAIAQRIGARVAKLNRHDVRMYEALREAWLPEERPQQVAVTIETLDRTAGALTVCVV